jgi:cobalt/nickel transport protein
MLKKILFFVLSIVIFPASMLFAHFQMIIPSKNIVNHGTGNKIKINVVFTHPFEGNMMNMEKPNSFGVMLNGKKTNLTEKLKMKKIKGFKTWAASYRFKKPGDYIFYVAPKPYWEPAENKFIIHYTKVVVDAYGLEEGWDNLVGFPAEIKPLVRPYGLWAGNIFRGVVLYKGKPVPFAEIEVEYYNKDGKIKAPSDPYITQVIKADKNGVFSYAMPKAGWWGFAALMDGDKINGKDVEIGALIWVKTEEMK